MGYLQRLLGNEEKVVFHTRRHWTDFFGRVAGYLLLFLIAAAAAVAANFLLAGLLVDRQAKQYELALRVAIVVVLITYPAVKVVLRYLQWQAEQYVVTNLRVIQLSGILSKQVLDSSLEKVNDVMLHQSLVGRILDHGDLEILTASEQAGNKFQRVARPLAFKAAMLNAKQELEAGTRGGSDDLAKLIADLAHLRDQGILTEQEFQAKKAQLLAS